MTDKVTDEEAAALVRRQQVLDLLARYCERVDEYDIDAMADCFSETATTDYGPGRGGPVAGRNAIARRIRAGQAEFTRTHHQLGQCRLSTDERSGSSLAYVTAWHERWNGDVETACLRYRDDVVRDADGAWRIAVRRVDAAVLDGFAGVPWTWVERRPPAEGAHATA